MIGKPRSAHLDIYNMFDGSRCLLLMSDRQSIRYAHSINFKWIMHWSKFSFKGIKPFILPSYEHTNSTYLYQLAYMFLFAFPLFLHFKDKSLHLFSIFIILLRLYIYFILVHWTLQPYPTPKKEEKKTWLNNLLLSVLKWRSCQMSRKSHFLNCTTISSFI